MLTFGEEVNRLMKEKGLVQVALAEKLGVNQSFVSKLVRGERAGLGADVLYRLCAALGVPTDHFKPFLAPDTVTATEPDVTATAPAKPKGKLKPDESVDDVDEAEARRFVRLLGSSLVAIVCRFVLRDPATGVRSPEQFCAVTAFAMTFDEIPVLLTAGHAIKDTLDPLLVEKKYEKQDVEVIETRICDFFGLNPKVTEGDHFVSYDRTTRGHVDEAKDRKGRGLDLGILFLPELNWRGIFANGVTPLNESFWANEDEQFDAYRMVGIPTTERLVRTGELQTASINVVPSTDPEAIGPDGKPNWFVGQLPVGITDVKGMSGGPIFGFRKRNDGSWEYRVVAMQSWQGAGNGVVYGTPFHHVGRIASAEVRRLAEEARGKKATTGKKKHPVTKPTKRKGKKK